jgi:hypothetical protein
VRESEVTSLELDFSTFGCLVVELVDPTTSRAFDGWARWTIADGEPVEQGNGELVLVGADPQVFERGPYLAGVLRSGTYTLRGHAPGWGPPADEDGYLKVEVLPGQVHTIRILLR